MIENTKERVLKSFVVLMMAVRTLKNTSHFVVPQIPFFSLLLVFLWLFYSCFQNDFSKSNRKTETVMLCLPLKQIHFSSSCFPSNSLPVSYRITLTTVMNCGMRHFYDCSWLLQQWWWNTGTHTNCSPYPHLTTLIH